MLDIHFHREVRPLSDADVTTVNRLIVAFDEEWRQWGSPPELTCRIAICDAVKPSSSPLADILVSLAVFLAWKGRIYYGLNFSMRTVDGSYWGMRRFSRRDIFRRNLPPMEWERDFRKHVSRPQA